MAFAALTAASVIAARISAVMPGAGASSMTFWWRRCSEQSRSNRCTALPRLSPNTCTSIWRGLSTYFSTSTAVVAESGLGLAPRAGQRLGEIVGAVDAPHALAAAAGARLDQHRIADLARLAGEQHQLLVFAVIARHHRHAGLFHQPLGGVLQPHGADRGGRRADEDQAGRRHLLDEVRIFRKEAVARMDRLRAGRLRRGDDPVAAQIAFGRPARRRYAPPRRPSRHAAPARRRRNRRPRCAMPSRRAVRMTRQAISPRLAIRILENIMASRKKAAGMPSPPPV